MVSTSIITNTSAFVALKNFQSIKSAAQTSNNRVSTGLRVASALDSASIFAIAQGIRAEVSAMSSVSQGLNNAKGIGKVALAGADGVSNLLGNIRVKLTELSNPGITSEQRQILESDFGKLMSQAGNFISNAEFNGANVLTAASTNVSTLSNLTSGSLTLNKQNLQTSAETLAAADISSSVLAQAALNTSVSHEAELEFSGAFYPTDEVYITIDGTQHTVTMDASTDTGDNFDNALTQIASALGSLANVSSATKNYANGTVDLVFSDTGAHEISLSLYDSGTGTNQTPIVGSVNTTINGDGVFNGLETAVNKALGGLGSDIRALNFQTEFLQDIRDATEEGLGNLVDADMAKESARMTSLQVQKQLSLQTLGIINQNPSIILGLFR
jgi:flagellin-like hook-associated protein FlgL